MRRLFNFAATVFALLLVLATPSLAEKRLSSESLNSCQRDNGFTASLFNVVFTPSNGSAHFDVTFTSSVKGNILFDISISAYGFEFLREKLDPCDAGLKGLCPITAGKMDFTLSIPVAEDQMKNIPPIAYSVPDLDALVRVRMNLTDTGESAACVEAKISNGKTVDLLGIKWATAIIAGLALLSSGIIFSLGYMNAAAHIATNALSLFGYFQSQAMLGLTALALPPIVQAWTQNFQWSMGIISLDFMQRIFTWYQRATGGTPASALDTLETTSVQVQKRALDVVGSAVSHIAKRENIKTGDGSYLVYGIQRAAFKANIETTNLFMTGLTFFCCLIVGTIFCIIAFKGFCELLVKQRVIASDRLFEFRNGWRVILKGVLVRFTLVGFPQMTILCLWEFTQKDSPAELALAAFFLLSITFTLVWCAVRIIQLARRSIDLHQSAAYILFSNPEILNKWGFLYIQFHANAYYFIIPSLIYIFIKSLFISLAQGNPVAQAVGFLIIEAAALIGTSVLRPWMDKSTNSFNIAIHAVSFINAIFLLVFSDVFGAPRLTIGVVGVVLFILNAIFSLVLLLMVLISTTLVYFRSNPDLRYQVMADDRTSFMRSQTHINNAPMELDALAANMRGDRFSTYLKPEVKEAR